MDLFDCDLNKNQECNRRDEYGRQNGKWYGRAGGRFLWWGGPASNL